MEQFSLEKYLENTSRKVITRDGRIVEILKVDAKGNHPIIGVYQFSDTEDMESSWHIDGKKTDNGESSFDLFFMDDELPEFEKIMIQFSHERNSLIQFEHTTEEINAHLYLYSEKLLDLARKELQPEFDKEMDKMLAETNKVVYQKGQQDALKSLSKWKKATENMEFDKHVLLFEDEDRVVLTTELYKDEYYIELDDLKTLPKEE